MCIGEQNPESGKIFLKINQLNKYQFILRAKKGLGIFLNKEVYLICLFMTTLWVLLKFHIKELKIKNQLLKNFLDEFNLQHLRTLNASVLSGGEIRRLMMARVMINKPKIVLLDEPLAALDPLVIQDIQKYILKIQSSGTAILVTDHNVKNLFDITDRSYVLR